MSSANYKIILISIGKSLANKSEDVVTILSSTFHIAAKEVSTFVDKAPIILFDNLSINEIKRLQNSVVFLSKMGIEIQITSENKEWKSTGWKFSKTPPIAECPSCGDTFFLLNSSAFLNHKIQNEVDNEESAAFEDLEGLSAELESIVDMESSIEEIEEIGSVSQELEEMGSFSEELEKIGDLAEELEELSRSDGFSQNNKASQIEDIEGISAEFEEIEGVSAEFERICMEDMEDIGSLSAELEEIEGISAEFEKISEDDIEKLDQASFSNFDLKGANKSEEKEIEKASSELKKTAEPLKELRSNNISNHSTQPKNKSKRVPAKSLVIQPGAYCVVININNQGNIALANKTISKLLQIPFERVVALTQKHRAITVANKISKETAQSILQQFQKYKMSGHITISK